MRCSSALLRVAGIWLAQSTLFTFTGCGRDAALALQIATQTAKAKAKAKGKAKAKAKGKAKPKAKGTAKARVEVVEDDSGDGAFSRSSISIAKVAGLLPPKSVKNVAQAQEAAKWAQKYQNQVQQELAKLLPRGKAKGAAVQFWIVGAGGKELLPVVGASSTSDSRTEGDTTSTHSHLRDAQVRGIQILEEAKGEGAFGSVHDVKLERGRSPSSGRSDPLLVKVQRCYLPGASPVAAVKCGDAAGEILMSDYLLASGAGDCIVPTLDVIVYPSDTKGVLSFVFLMQKVNFAHANRKLEADLKKLSGNQAVGLIKTVFGCQKIFNAANFVHGDIKAGNLGFTKDLKPKFIDFGTSGIVDPRTGSVVAGSCPYKDTEFLLKNGDPPEEDEDAVPMFLRNPVELQLNSFYVNLADKTAAKLKVGEKGGIGPVYSPKFDIYPTALALRDLLGIYNDGAAFLVAPDNEEFFAALNDFARQNKAGTSKRRSASESESGPGGKNELRGQKEWEAKVYNAVMEGETEQWIEDKARRTKFLRKCLEEMPIKHVVDTVAKRGYAEEFYNQCAN